LFLGDYQALSSIGNTFVPFYVATNVASPTNLTDVFARLLTTSVVTPVPIKAAPAWRALTAPPLPMTPDMQKMLSDSARSTLQRRFITRAPGPAGNP
jgi:hypothetical protein